MLENDTKSEDKDFDEIRQSMFSMGKMKFAKREQTLFSFDVLENKMLFTKLFYVLTAWK